jgi:hypothetical protein
MLACFSQVFVAPGCPVYTITLRPEPNVDPIRSLRRGLKLLLRCCGLRAVLIRQHDEQQREAA